MRPEVRSTAVLGQATTGLLHTNLIKRTQKMSEVAIKQDASALLETSGAVEGSESADEDSEEEDSDDEDEEDESSEAAEDESGSQSGSCGSVEENRPENDGDPVHSTGFHESEERTEMDPAVPETSSCTETDEAKAPCPHPPSPPSAPGKGRKLSMMTRIKNANACLNTALESQCASVRLKEALCFAHSIPESPSSPEGSATKERGTAGCMRWAQACQAMTTPNSARGLCPDDAFSEAKRDACLLYTSPSPRDQRGSRMPSSA